MSEALGFVALRVHRLLGIDGTGFVLDGLSPGINIVHGPNASGKTTTARAIQALLWPATAPSRAVLEGRFLLGGAEWRVDLEAGAARWQREGADADPPPLPAPDAARRYTLPLHELLDAEDGDFAATIARETVGGYDLVGAADALGFREAASRATSERRALEDAQRELREARRRQERLRADEERLGALEEKRRAAEAARRRLELWDRALQHLEARAALAEARAEVEAFPDGLSRLHGDEVERLRGIARAAEEAREKRRAAERDLAEAVRRREATRLEAPPPGELLAAARADLERVRRLERERDEAERRLAEAEARAEEELRAIGGAVDGTALAALDAVAFDELAGFAERAEELSARRAALEAERAVLADAVVPDDLDRAREGVRLLRRWLASGVGAGRERRLRRLALAAAAVATVAGALLGLLHPALAAAAVPGLLLGALALRREPGDAASEQLERAFRGLGLDGPRAWEREAVEARLDALERTVAEGRVAEARALRREQVEARLGGVAAELEALDAERLELAARLGAAPDTDPVKLYWLANRIGRWQDASHAAASAKSAREAAAGQLARAVAAANGRLARYGYDGATGASELAGAIEDLDARRHALAEALAFADGAATRRAEADEALERLRADRAAIFERLGLGPDADAEVAEWCDRRGAYLQARERLTRAEARLEQAHAALAAHPDYAPDIEARTAAEIAGMRRADEESARELDGLVETIHAIRRDVAREKEKHDLEAALARVEAAETALRAARDRDLRAVLGHVLTRFVHESSRDHDRPPVFRRARELFLRITGGRYRLDLDDGDGDAPKFRAYDTATGRGHALDELSSGTRVQLLLAVRVAFVETQERGVRLPLLLDETLGNSDDTRAAAIMEAVAALARDGRQVFYFTAQADEVGKWRALLDATEGVAYRLVDLRRARSLPGGGADALHRLEPPAAGPPAPAGLDHATYGEALGVPPIDPWAPARAAHLWYLVEDVELLHSLLGLGIETWGMLRELVESGGAALPVLTGGAYERIAAAARALDAALDAWRIGRGRPFDRAALEASGAVSDKFIDLAAECCRKAGGDAARALEAIGALPRFRTDKLDELRAFLVANGYLDPDPPLPTGGIWARALGAAAADIADGRIGRTDIERMLNRVAGRPTD